MARGLEVSGIDVKAGHGRQSHSPGLKALRVGSPYCGSLDLARDQDPEVEHTARRPARGHRHVANQSGDTEANLVLQNKYSLESTSRGEPEWPNWQHR